MGHVDASASAPPMTARAAVFTALLCVLAFANCRALSVRRCDETSAQGGEAGGGVDATNDDTATPGRSGSGGARIAPEPPEAGKANAGAASNGGAPTVPAGEGGAVPASAGEPGSPDLCDPPFENCDETWLNGCEVNLQSDPFHCGGCRIPCDGVCSRYGCHEAQAYSNQSVSG